MADTADVQHLTEHEELLQKKEERLQMAHQRRMEQEPGHVSKSPGKGAGEFFSFLGEHKMLFLGIGGAVVIIVIIYYVIQANNANSANSTANQSPNLTNGGYMPSDISAQLASINDQLSSLGATLTSPGSPTTNPPPNNGGGGGVTGGCVTDGSCVKPVLPDWVGGTAQIMQQGSDYFLVQGNKRINLNTLFPTGTTFAGGGGGRAWYTLPGGQQTLLVAHGFGVNGWRGQDLVFMQSTPKGLRTISSGV